MILKLKLFTEDEEGIFDYLDFYCDSDGIMGFYVPKKDVEQVENTINLFYMGQVITVIQSDILINYLKQEFVDYANI